MEIKPVIQDLVCYPEVSRVEDKFGPVVLQVLPKLRLQNPSSLRLALSDGTHQVSGVYQRSGPIEEDFFKEGQLIEIKKYQLLLSNGRPYIFFLGFEPRGIAEMNQPERLTASLFESMRRSKGLNLDGTANGTDATSDVAEVSDYNAVTDSRHVDQKPSVKKPKDVIGIEALSPFADTWKIRVRCMQKSDIITYKKGDREGKLFNVTFVDETGEIRATGFNDDVDKWFPKLKENDVYFVSGLKVNNANKKFSTTNNNFELIFTRDSNVEQTEADRSIPTLKVSYTSLDKLSTLPVQRNVDVIGIITTVGDCTTINSRSGQTFEKRSIFIADQTNTSVEVSLWGKDATEFIGRVSEPIAIKSAKLSEFMGTKNLTVQRSSVLMVNPVSPDAISLKTWYGAEGVNTTFAKLKSDDASESDKRKMEVDNIVDALTNRKDGEYFTIKGCVETVLPRTLYYPACAEPNCMKKAIQTTSGDWQCDSCNKEFSSPEYRFILNVIAMDSVPSPGMRISVFDDIGKELLDTSANEVAALREADEESEELKDILKRPQGREYYFKIQSKQESYNGQENMRYRCVRLMPIYYNRATSDILSEL